MEEKFSVSLELMIQKFKDGAKKAQEVSQNVASKIKENMSVDVGSNAFKGMNAESELLLNKINDIKATLQMASADPKLLPKQDILEMRVELEKLEGQYNKINQSSNMFSSSFNKIQDGMKKSLNSAKRFTLSLFSIQSVYRMLSRASSAYLAQDEETSSKIQSAWIGLGSVFAPLLSMIANFTIKAVSYINVFIKALTGTDFLANAMSKSMNKASKSAGKLSKMLAGFDELTNLDDSAGGVSVDTSWIDAFKNVPLDPNVVKWIETLGAKTKEVWEKIKPMITGIKDIFAPVFNYILTNWDLVGSSVIDIISGIGILIGIATGNWIAVFVGLFIVIANNWENIKGLFKVGVDFILGLFNLLGELIRTPINLIVNLFKIGVDTIKNLFKDLYSMIGGIIDSIKLILDGIIKFITGVFSGNWKKAWEGIRNIFSGIISGITEIFKGIINVLISVINGMIKSVNKFIVGGLNKLLGVGKIIGINLSIPNIPEIPKLEVGTPNVERSGYAMIHEGEAVVPKKFNSDEYFSRLGGNNNEQTNKLLEDLIDRVEQIEINPYTTIKDVGSASVSYINNQKRVLGRGVI